MTGVLVGVRGMKDGRAVPYFEEVLLSDPVMPHMWHVIGRDQDFGSQPAAARLLDLDLVVWRTADGAIHAAQNLCMHRASAFVADGLQAEVVDDCLECPYHALLYDRNGVCTSIPQAPSAKIPITARLNMVHARAAYGWVWVCLDEPRHAIPPFGEWGDPQFQLVHWQRLGIAASAPRVAENFLDVAHLGKVHPGLLGDPAQLELQPFSAQLTPDRGVVATPIRLYQPDPDGTGKPGFVTYEYCAPGPLSAYFSKQTQGDDGAGGHFAIYFTVTPVSRALSNAYMIICLDYGHESDDAVRAFQDIIFDQDTPIVQAQKPELLPLTRLADEWSMWFDAISIQYRQWLRRLGVTYLAY